MQPRCTPSRIPPPSSRSPHIPRCLAVAPLPLNHSAEEAPRTAPSSWQAGLDDTSSPPPPVLRHKPTPTSIRTPPLCTQLSTHNLTFAGPPTIVHSSPAFGPTDPSVPPRSAGPVSHCVLHRTPHPRQQQSSFLPATQTPYPVTRAVARTWFPTLHDNISKGQVHMGHRASRRGDV